MRTVTRTGLRAAGVAAVALVGMVGTVTPAHAAPIESSGSVVGTCGSVAPGVYVKLYTHWVNDDRGSVVRIKAGSNAVMEVRKCTTNALVSVSGSLTWDILASGWGLDGCSVGKGSFDCSVTSKGTQYSDSVGLSGGVAKRVVGTDENLYFQDGGVGDITKVCSKVTGSITVSGTKRAISTGYICASAT